jgi:hypothetical protein
MPLPTTNDGQSAPRNESVHLRQGWQAVDQGVVRKRLQGSLQGRRAAHAHGCRKIAATRAAEAGATVAQLNAIFGWKGTAMASLYTEAADRKRLALEAMEKVQGASAPERSCNIYSLT